MSKTTHSPKLFRQEDGNLAFMSNTCTISSGLLSKPSISEKLQLLSKVALFLYERMRKRRSSIKPQAHKERKSRLKNTFDLYIVILFEVAVDLEKGWDVVILLWDSFKYFASIKDGDDALGYP